MELLLARKKLLEMARKDIAELEQLSGANPDDCRQAVAVIAKRLTHTIHVLENDTERLAVLIREMSEM